MKKRITSAFLILLLTAALVMVVSVAGNLQVHATSGDPGMFMGSDVLGDAVNTADAQKVYYGGKDWYVIAYDGAETAPWQRAI